MPQVVFTPQAVHDLQRIRDFLKYKSPAAAIRAAGVIKETISELELNPFIGRPADGMPPHFRELLIEFGSSGYVAMYRYDGSDPLVILAIRHQKEAGF